jgi:hypothetical protein
MMWPICFAELQLKSILKVFIVVVAKLLLRWTSGASSSLSSVDFFGELQG